MVLLHAGLDALGEDGGECHPSLWRSLIERMAWVRFRQGRLEEAFSLASSATLGLDALDNQDPMQQASLYNTLGGVLWQQGNLPEAIVYVERGLQLNAKLHYLWGMAGAHTNLGVLCYARGDWSKAIEHLEQAEALQRRIGDRQNQAITLNNLGTLRQSMGDHEAARADMEKSLAIRQRLGDAWGVAQSQISLARLDVTQSRHTDARAHVQAAMTAPVPIGAYEVEARWILALIEAESNLQAGMETASRALEEARARGFPEQEADCCRVLGTLAARSGEYVEAESLLRESVHLFHQLDTPYNRGLALLELGRLYATRAHASEADGSEWQTRSATALAEAAEIFEGLGAAHDLSLTRAILRLSEVRKTAEPADPVSPAPHNNEALAPSDADRRDAEWRTAAIVWLDLRPAPGADEEMVFEGVAAAIPALTAIAQELSGQTIRRPAGLTVVFGAPTSFEDDTERAVLAARQMVQHMHEMADGAAPCLYCGAAVSRGEVVAGQIESSFHSEFVVKGPPVQQAQQLAEIAPSGVVCVTEAVRTATERTSVYEKAQLVTAQDDAPAWQLVGLRDDPAPARGLPGLSAELIGRENQLHSMADLVQNLSRGFGGLVWIEGEPGIGKSRLIREFAALVSDTEALVLSATCSPQKSGKALALFSDVFAPAIGLEPTDTPTQTRAKLQEAVQQWPRDAQVTQPYLEMLLGIWPEGVRGEHMASLEPEQLRQQTFVSVRRLLKSLSNKRPIVLLLDDLHWVDPMSAELLQFLMVIVASSPVLFVCAQRRQGADLPNDRLVKIQSLIPSQTAQILLDRLTEEESGTLIDELLPGIELPPQLRASIVERSEGNPYFIEEYVRMLIGNGSLQHRDTRWEIDSDATLAIKELPASLEALIRSRIDALPPELKHLVECAAVLGAPFEAGMLASVYGLGKVADHLRRLESRLLVTPAPQGDDWQFQHTLIEGVVYGGMLKSRRRALHLKAGTSLEALWAGAEREHAEELAYHFSRAGESAKALDYLMEAGERAAQRYANQEAIGYLEQAAEWLDLQSSAPDSLRWRLSAALGDVYRAMGRYADSMVALKAGLALVHTADLPEEAVVGIYRRLGETAQKQGELESAESYFAQALQAVNALDDDRARSEFAKLTTGLAWTYFAQGNLERARQACRASLAYARAAGSLGELAAAENLLGGIHYRGSEWSEAIHHTRRAMVLREQMGYTWGVASTLSNLGILAISSGEWNKANSFFGRSLSLRQDLGDAEGVVIVRNNLGIVAQRQGDLDLAEEHFRESLRAAKTLDMGFHIGNAHVGLAQVLVLKGEVEAAREAIAVSLEQAKAIGASDMLGEALCIQAEIALAAAAPAEAQALAEESAALAAEVGNRDLEAIAWRTASEAALQQGELAPARALLSRAEHASVEVTDELESGRMAAQKGRILMHEGLPGEADTHFREAQLVFMRLGAKLDLARVEDALRESAVWRFEPQESLVPA
jgi:predicted ATPase